MDRGAWWATVHRATQSQTRLKQLSTHTLTAYIFVSPIRISVCKLSGCIDVVLISDAITCTKIKISVEMKCF